MTPAKKPVKPKPPEPDEPEDLEPDDDDDRDDEPERTRNPNSEGELKIVVRPDIIELDIPRDGSEADTLERIARLVDDL